MPSPEDRYANLVARCSREAWLRLQHLFHQPTFAAVATELEKISGTIYETDVQAAYQRVLMQTPAAEPSSHAGDRPAK